MTANHTNIIEINDEVKMHMRYPVLSDMKETFYSGNLSSKIFDIMNTCIEKIEWGEKIYQRVDITKQEINDFIDSMSNSNLDSLIEFFDTMPKLRHTIQVTNPKTNVKSNVVVEGLQNFLA